MGVLETCFNYWVHYVFVWWKLFVQFFYLLCDLRVFDQQALELDREQVIYWESLVTKFNWKPTERQVGDWLLWIVTFTREVRDFAGVYLFEVILVDCK